MTPSLKIFINLICISFSKWTELSDKDIENQKIRHGADIFSQHLPPVLCLELISDRTFDGET